MGTTYYFLPTRNLFGEDSVKETGELMKSLGGKKAMIVTDGFLAQSGMAADIQKILSESGVESVVFGGAEPNPKDVNVEAGLKVFQEMPAIPSFPWEAVPPTTAPRASDWWPPTAETSGSMRGLINPQSPCAP